MEDRFNYRVVRGKSPLYKEGEIIYFNLGDEIGFGENDIKEQCTGLKSKDGKFIYEGDIIGGLFGSPVIWCDRCHSFELGFPTDGSMECMSCNGDVLWSDVIDYDGYLEVLGNIHNKYLVKELFS